MLWRPVIGPCNVHLMASLLGGCEGSPAKMETKSEILGNLDILVTLAAGVKGYRNRDT